MEEVVSLDSDRMSLPSRQPVASGGTVRILVNDEFFIPQGGLYTPAVLRASGSGPYDIVENEDRITITTSAGSQSFSFGISNTVSRMSANDVVSFLTTRLLTVATATSENGHLVLSDLNRVGPDSYVKISGTAAISLGFGAPKTGTSAANHRQWSSRGVQLYPPWRLHTRPDEITNRFPKFDQPISSNPVFKVTYTATPHRCLRCGGTYVENDYRFDQSGQLIMIQNEDLLYQAALKIVLTDRGSNPYYPWYGSSVKSRVGSKAISGVAALIGEDIRRALTKFQDLQKEQSKFQKVSFKERLLSVVSVNAYPHVQDSTTYMVDVVLQNASSEAINLSIVFTVPNVVALMGSNGLMLGTEASGVNTRFLNEV